MTTFAVPEMSCGHCTSAIERAIRAADPAASVVCDLKTRRVHVTSAVDDEALAGTIRAAGYEVEAAGAT